MTAPSVLHLVPSRAWGGAEQVADTLRRLAVEHGWSATMDLPPTQGAPWSPDVPESTSWLAWSLRRRRHPTVVHAHLPWPDRLGPALLAARGLPLVVTFHLLPAAGTWPRDRVAGLSASTVMRLAGRVRSRVRWVALSRADAAVLTPWLGDSVHCIRNAPPVPRPAVAPIAWPASGLRLLTVGRLAWQKGYDLLLDALAHPTVRVLPWHWVLLGDGEDRHLLTQRVLSLGLGRRVTFEGARPAAEGLGHAQVVLAPSRHEGMPLVPLEAAEAGVPVLASAIAPHRELYAASDDTRPALLPEDHARWPGALARWFQDPQALSALALAQRRVLGDTPRQALWSAYEALYRDVAAGTRHP